MWVLLEFYNAYDQEGGYFAGIFDSKEEAENAAGHLGRVDYESSWYEAKQYELNKRVGSEDREI